MPNYTAAVIAYRNINPWSRAEAPTTLYGSSSAVRRATCIFCREVIATCSNKWPATKTYEAQIEEHTPECLQEWLEVPKHALAYLAAVNQCVGPERD